MSTDTERGEEAGMSEESMTKREKAWARLYDEAASENAVLKDRIRELEAEDAEATEREPDGRWGAIMAMAEHQVRDGVHPLTCAERGDHPVRYGDKGVLWPALTPGGDPMLVCPDCDYTQEWPHHLPINPDFGDPDADRTEPVWMPGLGPCVCDDCERLRDASDDQP